VTDADVQITDPHTLVLKLVRPASTPRAPDEGEATGDTGEPAEVQVFLGTGQESNRTSLRFDTFKMVVFGDSIAWGQGLQEHLKFHSLVEQHIREQRSEIGVYKAVRAHSGATIGRGNEATRAPLVGEVNTPLPTIRQQVEAYSGRKDSVKLILLDGGINDFGVSRLLDPRDDTDVVQRVEERVYNRMRDLLATLTGVDQTVPDAYYPNAKIVVTGYYPIVGDRSNFLLVKYMLAYCFGPLAPFAGILDEIFGWTDDMFEEIAERCRTFADTANQRLGAAVDETNEELWESRVFFANPQFTSLNAVFAPRSYLWGLHLSGSFIQDTPDAGGVAPERAEACAAAPPERLADGEFICTMASVGHPNLEGAVRYANAIRALPITN
jgi:lysophospholipase L1-like esterase